jgi:hypothetical protein
MANTTPEDYLRDKETQIAAIMDGSDKAFNSVWIGPSVDLEKMLRVPRTPLALITDGGGQLQKSNGRVWDRVFYVTIIVSKPRDHVGRWATLECMRLGTLLRNALKTSRADDAVFCYEDTEEAELQNDSGGLFVAKTYPFTYSIVEA